MNIYIGEIETSVIGSLIINQEIKKEENRTESDYIISIVVELEVESKKNMKKKDIIKIERNIWTEKGISHYHTKCERWRCIQSEIKERCAE